jgi:serpin B
MTSNGAAATRALRWRRLSAWTRRPHAYLHTWLASLPPADKYKLAIANTVWFRNDGSLDVRRISSRKTRDYYGAQVYSPPLGRTLRDINGWVKTTPTT